MPTSTRTSEALGDAEAVATAVSQDAEGDSQELTQIKKGALKVLKEKAQKLTQANQLIKKLKADYEKLSKNSTKLQKQLDTIAKSLEAVNQLKDGMEQELDARDKTIAALTEQLEQLKESLRKGGKVAACELNQTLVDLVLEAAKKILFRTVKFVVDDEDLKKLTADVIKHLPNKAEDIKPLTVEQFTDLYFLTVNEGIKMARQYVCNEGKKRVQGKPKTRPIMNLLSKLRNLTRPHFAS